MSSGVVRRPVWARGALSKLSPSLYRPLAARPTPTISKVTGNSLAMYLKWLDTSMPLVRPHRRK